MYFFGSQNYFSTVQANKTNVVWCGIDKLPQRKIMCSHVSTVELCSPSLKYVDNSLEFGDTS